MFNKYKFKAAVMERGMNIEGVAKRIGMSGVTLYRKMNGVSDFYRDEIKQLCVLLNITNRDEIFFADDVAKTQYAKEDVL